MRTIAGILFCVAVCAGGAEGKALRQTQVGGGARSLAVGEGGAAALTGAESLFWNPAGMAGCGKPEFLLGHTSWVEDLSAEAGAAVMPLGEYGYAGVVAGWQAFTGIEERNADGTLARTFSLTTGSASAAWACRVTDYLSAGVSGGFMQQKGLGFSENDIPLGVGVRGTVAEVVLAASGMEILSPQPAYHIGASCHVAPGGYGMLLSGGAILREYENRVGAGTEIEAGKLLKVRVGYMFPLEKSNLGGFSNLTAGLGFSYQAIGIDYAFLPLGDIGQVHRLQLTYSLGEGAVAEAGK